MHPGSKQPGSSLAALTRVSDIPSTRSSGRKVLSHCERESLILNESLPYHFPLASDAGRKNTCLYSPGTDGIKLAPMWYISMKTVLSHSAELRGEVSWHH